MIINFLGDSITEYAGASCRDNCYVNMVGKALDCTVRNYGICGSRIARQSTPSADTKFDYDFNLRAQIMDKNADYIFVFGGTNDYGHGDASMGNCGDMTPYTFCGAINCLIKTLKDGFCNSNICFILPLPRYNEKSLFGEGCKTSALYPLQAYRENEKIILQKNGVDFLDLSTAFPVPKSNKGDEYTIDGLHPNDKGHKTIADVIVDYIRSKK